MKFTTPMKFATPLLGLSLTLALAAAPEAKHAVATVNPASSAATRPTDTHVTGLVTFTQTGDELAFVADVDGLAPHSEHGFHIHEKGDLSDAGLLKAGGHYNPTHEKHGGPHAQHHHAGDLGNLTADDKGHAHLMGTLPGVKLDDIVGRSVIIHAKADDLKSQPTGESGGRVAGGKITAAGE